MEKQITYLDFIVRGEGLDVMDITGKSDPFLVIKVPTKIMMKRNIFEYETDVLVTEHSPRRGELAASIQRKNSQGNIVLSEDFPHVVEEHTNFLASWASSVFHTHSPYLYHKKAYSHTEGYKVVFESEVVKANLNPLWQPFRIGFYELCKGNTNVELLIECYDWDLFKHSDFIGSCKVSVQALLESKEEQHLQLISKKGKSGTLVLKCCPSAFDIVYCDFKACGADLAEKNVSGLSDPYFVIKSPLAINERRNNFSFSYDGNIVPAVDKMKYGTQTHPATDGYREIYESPVIKNTINPEWGLFQLGFHDMCKGNTETKLRIECYDYNDITKNKIIGIAEISVQSIIDTRGKLAIALLSRKHKKAAGIIYLHCKPSNSNTRLRTT
jgi:Ca2+-dependent lipid-binding protein